jgi:toxin ParE1/3/4
LKPLTYHPEASDEIDEAYTWYAVRSITAADGFYEELFPAVSKLCQQPSLFPAYLHGTRRVVLDRYPYSIVYRDLLEEIQIVAVAHAKRRPSYWANRL